MSSAPRARPGRVRRLRVPTELGGERLDRILAALLSGVSRTRIQAAIRAGGVRRSGAVLERPREPVESGVELEVDLSALAPEARAAPDGPGFEVVYEDEELAVIDKPAGMLAHGGARARGGTVAELAVARFGELPSAQGTDRPGIVHRLDAGTSGLMVLGRTPQALAGLMRQFRERQVEKTYLAFAWGDPRFESEWIRAPLARRSAGRGRVGVVPAGEGREAETFYEVEERYGIAALLACQPRSGRTHQVRAHLHHAGHPLIGDPLYRPRGGPPARLPAEAPLPKRQALHAHRLGFRHPSKGDVLRFESPLPADLAQLRDWLRASY